MRTLLFIFSALFIFSCSEDPVETCTEISLGTSINIKNNELVCIDGVEYTFKAFDDRCPCDTVCAWEGEFRMTFEENNSNTVYTYHTSSIMENDDAIIGESVVFTIDSSTDCGTPDIIDTVVFSVLFQ